MSWGIRKWILPENIYKPIVDKTWKGLFTYSVHPNGFFGYIQGTAKSPSDSQPVTYNTVPGFEDFAIGCFLLGSIEYYRLIY